LLISEVKEKKKGKKKKEEEGKSNGERVRKDLGGEGEDFGQGGGIVGGVADELRRLRRSRNFRREDLHRRFAPRVLAKTNAAPSCAWAFSPVA